MQRLSKNFVRSLYADSYLYHRLPPSERFGMWAGAAHSVDREFIKRTTGKVLLDIGCGPPDARSAVKDIDCGRYIGLDFITELRPDVVSSVDNLALADSSVDSINCISVLEHVYNPSDAISEMYRVLRGGGVVRVQVPFLLQFHGYPSDYFRYTHVALRKMFEDVGFRVECVETDWSRGPVLTAAKMLEDGSWSYNKRGWIFLTRIFAALLFRLSPIIDPYSAPGQVGMYNAVVLLGSKPVK